jgi:hypothetical protein
MLRAVWAPVLLFKTLSYVEWYFIVSVMGNASSADIQEYIPPSPDQQPVTTTTLVPADVGRPTGTGRAC